MRYHHYGLALLLVAGCAPGPASRVQSQASFDHDCPAKSIEILEEDEDIWAYKLRVCGELRKYRDMGNEAQWQFVDVTDGPPKGRP